jgi:hypothetical protein
VCFMETKFESRRFKPDSNTSCLSQFVTNLSGDFYQHAMLVDRRRFLRGESRHIGLMSFFLPLPDAFGVFFTDGVLRDSPSNGSDPFASDPLFDGWLVEAVAPFTAPSAAFVSSLMPSELRVFFPFEKYEKKKKKHKNKEKVD